jgi:hypothetical protein
MVPFFQNGTIKIAQKRKKGTIRTIFLQKMDDFWTIFAKIHASVEKRRKKC